MLDVCALLDRARAVLTLKSDRQLSVALGLDGTSVYSFRQGHALPAPETIIKLCQIVGDEPMIALADLGAMKSKGEARTVYERMAAILREKAA
jgi:hypothetical protein